MILLLKARKFININRTEFQLTTYDDESKEYRECCSMVSNLDRSKFNLSEFEKGYQQKRMLGTICSTVNLKNDKSLIMYYPRVNERNQPTIFHLHSSDSDLQLVYRQNGAPNVNFLMTTKLELAKRLQLMSCYELRSSQKSMEFKSSQGEMKVIIGKRASKRYKIIAAPGLSPVQIFALTIVQIET